METVLGLGNYKLPHSQQIVGQIPHSGHWIGSNATCDYSNVATPAQLTSLDLVSHLNQFVYSPTEPTVKLSIHFMIILVCYILPIAVL